jgi:hypothetical protein
MKMWTYADLEDANIVRSRMTLKRAIDEGRFAPGRLISPNRRVWTDEEVEALIASSPVARKTELRRQAQAACLASNAHQ